MITDDRITSFIKSFMTDNTAEIKDIETKAREEGVPIIRKEAESFLQTMVAMNRPENILEIGSAVGYSGILMATAYVGAHITTIELDSARAAEARGNFEKLGLSDRIDLIEGDAAVVLEDLARENKKFDFVFMDAAKGQYINWLPDVMRLMKNGGVLISDNVLQEGDIIESHYLVERRNRTIYKRMREYLYELKHNPSLITSIIPLGDGVTVSVKQE